MGRAGRLTGNALVVSLLPARPLELQRLMDPLTMIAGDVVPPACYLDATEILRRQYLASLFDRHARSVNPGRTRLARDVFTGGLADTSWLGRIVADGRAHAQAYVDEFLRGFGDAVSKVTAADLRSWAGDGGPAGEPPGFERDVEAAVAAWVQEGEELATRFTALAAEIALMQARPSLDEAGERDLRRLFGELGAARGAAAINLLGQILNQWQPRPIETIKRIVVGSHDTPIEMRLRALLLRWAKSKGAAVSTQATSHGDSAKITFPQSLGDLQWALAPQVKLGGVQPDFVLTCVDHEVPRIAVFCDSQRWHSSVQANCLAVDAANRAGLRDHDYLVWAVTHHDLDAFAAALDGQPAEPPAWCEDRLRVMFLQVAQKMAPPGSVKPDTLLRDPVSMLTEFLLRPSRKA